MKEGGGMLFVDCKPTCQPIERLKSMSWVHRVRLPPSSLAQRLVRYAPTLTAKDLSGLNEWEVLIYSRVSVRQVFLSWNKITDNHCSLSLENRNSPFRARKHILIFCYANWVFHTHRAITTLRATCSTLRTFSRGHTRTTTYTYAVPSYVW